MQRRCFGFRAVDNSSIVTLKRAYRFLRRRIEETKNQKRADPAGANAPAGHELASAAAGIETARETQIPAALDHELFVSVIYALSDARSVWRRTRTDSFESSIFARSTNRPSAVQRDE
jgi:hypothetical protein